MATTNNKPATTLRRGIVKATIWENTSKNGPFFSTTFSRSYKERSGKWSNEALSRFNGKPSVFRRLLKRHFSSNSVAGMCNSRWLKRFL